MSDNVNMFCNKEPDGTYEISYTFPNGRSGTVINRINNQFIVAKEVNLVDNRKEESVKILNLREEIYDFKYFIDWHFDYIPRKPRCPILPEFRGEQDVNEEFEI